MWSSIGKAALAASFVALTPAAAVLSGGQAQADVYVSGGVTVGSPNLIVGFSFGDPFAVGHVHYSPVHCAVGPLFYYPAYGVYAHYYPRYEYAYYPAPLGYHDVHVYHYGHGYHKGGHGHRHHGYRHGGGHYYDGYRGHGWSGPKHVRGHYARHSDGGKAWRGGHRDGHKGYGSNHKGNGSGHKGKGRKGNGNGNGGRGNGTRGHGR